MSETTIISAVGKMRGKPWENHIFRPNPPFFSENGHIFAHPEKEWETVRKNKTKRDPPMIRPSACTVSALALKGVG